MKKRILALCAAAAIITACESAPKDCCAADTKTATAMKAPFTKKYTNADYYKDGVFQQDVAKQAYREMFEYYNYPVTPLLEQEWWVSDFGMGDFESCGMGGVFWVNDADHGYFAHDIYLLPTQMIPEHKHVATKFPAKFESWMVRDGMCYNFDEVGESIIDYPGLIPASQQKTTKSQHYVKQKQGELIHLAKPETWHFLRAGDNGAIVMEYANYHDGAGLRFSNPNAKL